MGRGIDKKRRVNQRILICFSERNVFTYSCASSRHLRGWKWNKNYGHWKALRVSAQCDAIILPATACSGVKWSTFPARRDFVIWSKIQMCRSAAVPGRCIVREGLVEPPYWQKCVLYVTGLYWTWASSCVCFAQTTLSLKWVKVAGVWKSLGSNGKQYQHQQQHHLLVSGYQLTLSRSCRLACQDHFIGVSGVPCCSATSSAATGQMDSEKVKGIQMFSPERLSLGGLYRFGYTVLPLSLCSAAYRWMQIHELSQRETVRRHCSIKLWNISISCFDWILWLNTRMQTCSCIKDTAPTGHVCRQ